MEVYVASSRLEEGSIDSYVIGKSPVCSFGCCSLQSIKRRFTDYKTYSFEDESIKQSINQSIKPLAINDHCLT